MDNTCIIIIISLLFFFLYDVLHVPYCGNPFANPKPDHDAVGHTQPETTQPETRPRVSWSPVSRQCAEKGVEEKS